MENGGGFDDNLDFSGIWSGGKTPDLNGPGLFLRGGSEDEVLMTQESSIQDHEHQDDQHSHGCSANFLKGFPFRIIYATNSVKILTNF